MDDTQPNSCLKKILEVMNRLEALPKRGYNSFSNYHYIMEGDAAEAIRRACVEVGIVIIPSVVESDIVYHDAKGGYANVTIAYRIIDPDSGDTLESVYRGSAKDTSDKALGKAYSNAQKFFYLKFFHLSGFDDS